MSKVECPSRAAPRREGSEQGCEILLQEEGPLGPCHPHLDPRRYFQDCLRDFCLFPTREDVVCSIVAHYAASCQALGVAIGSWRTEQFCNVSCPPHSHYELCCQDCARSCGGGGGGSVPTRCSARCREGCACDGGFALSGDQCVPTSQCGCHHQDLYYKLEETFSPSEEERCRCRAGGRMECQNTTECPGGGEGEVIDGVFQCPPATPGTCVATGDRAYLSFDGVAFNVSGTCSYVLAETGAGAEVPRFVVKVEKEARQKRKVSGITALTVEVYGLNLTLRRDKRGAVMVDSVSHNLPTILSQGRVWVQRHGLGVLLQTDFGLVVHYDLLQHAAVTVPQPFRGHLRGLCGNYNGQGRDDLLLPGGQEAPDSVAFGSAWKTPEGSCSDECPQDSCPPCTERKLRILRKRNYCGVLVAPDGPFGSCHRLLDPDFYFQSCLHDLCLAQGDTQVLCQSLQSYAAACQHAGGVIGAWRKPNLCPLPCPANSSHSLCTDHCTNSCGDLGNATKCPQTCLEGCQCHQGLVFNGHACVAPEECGCWQEGQYYQ
ncbi:IgGFc-binding protein-like, partial [Heliangelus exortis]|uniref:IgGFc-binding protein-like n=1 Tax=Heliangelus exortis TaxID=472823 RepID=UPI003A8FDD0A